MIFGENGQKSVIFGVLSQMGPRSQLVDLRDRFIWAFLQFKVHIRTVKNLRRIGVGRFGVTSPLEQPLRASGQPLRGFSRGEVTPN